MAVTVTDSDGKLRRISAQTQFLRVESDCGRNTGAHRFSYVSVDAVSTARPRPRSCPKPASAPATYNRKDIPLHCSIDGPSKPIHQCNRIERYKNRCCRLYCPNTILWESGNPNKAIIPRGQSIVSVVSLQCAPLHLFRRRLCGEQIGA
jgi:hypothetical protein